MRIRSAYWLGQPHKGQEESFRAAVEGVLVPAMRGFPGVSAVKLLWPRGAEPGAPPLHCQVVVEFADAAAEAAMLACPERAALRPRVLEAVALFDGTMAHIDFEVA